jgi:hypothetical protein
VKERVLKRLTLDQAIQLFSSRKWNFFEVRTHEGIVRLEAPVGTAEAYVVEVPYRDDEHLKEMVNRMLDHGFLEQERRYIPE